MRKRQRKLEKYIEGLEQQTDYLQDHNTLLVNENKDLKDKNEKMMKYMKGLEWDIENICIYLEKEQEKDK